MSEVVILNKSCSVCFYTSCTDTYISYFGWYALSSGSDSYNDGIYHVHLISDEILTAA